MSSPKTALVINSGTVKCEIHWSLHSGPWQSQQKNSSVLSDSPFFLFSPFRTTCQDDCRFRCAGFPNSGISSLSWSAASTWRVPHCQQAGVFSLPFYEPRLAERVCQSASNSTGVEVTRRGIESFAPDILRIFPHRGCRDRNVQKTTEWQKQAMAWEPSCRTLREKVLVLVLMCPSCQVYVYGSSTTA